MSEKVTALDKYWHFNQEMTSVQAENRSFWHITRILGNFGLQKMHSQYFSIESMTVSFLLYQVRRN